MTNTGTIIVRFLLILSVLIPALYIVIKIYKGVQTKLHPDKTQKRNSEAVLLFCALTISSAVFMLNYALEISRGDFGLFNGLVKSIISGMKSLGGEMGYADDVETLKELVIFAGGGKAFSVFFSYYYPVLNLASPIAGGALILEVLVNIFPALKLKAANLCKSRKKYFFNELNEGSLALAESIAERKYKFFCRPVIIFTDAYIEGKRDKSSELYTRAKNIGAFCINEDIAHFTNKRIKNIEYLLIKENEIDNIKTLAALVDDDKYKLLEGAAIRIFYQDDSYVLTENQIHLRLREKFTLDQMQKNKISSKKFINRRRELALEELKKDQDKNLSLSETQIQEKINNISPQMVYETLVDEVAPVIVRTRAIQNLIWGLLENKPLFTPLLENPNQEELNVCILGSGTIGMEMFTGSYWCGQLLDKKLGINMLSLEPEQNVINKINNISPEILKSSVEKAEILSVYDVQRRIDYLKKLEEKAKDLDNQISELDEIKDEISKIKDSIENIKDIYSDPYFTFRYKQADLLSEPLDEIAFKKVCDDSENQQEKNILDCDYFLVAFGSDEKNIVVAENLRRELVSRSVNTQKKKSAIIVCVVYDPSLCALLNEGKLSMAGDNSDSAIEIVTVGGLNDVYCYNNIFKSRVKADLIHSSYVEKSRKELMAESKNRIRKAYDYFSSSANSVHAIYKSFCAFEYRVKNNQYKSDFKQWIDEYGKDKWCKDDELRQLMGWLEHRRWTAYVRSCGFKLRTDYGKKEVMLKLHPCLVEMKHPNDTTREPDRLDDLSVAHNNEPYKEYDLPKIYKA